MEQEIIRLKKKKPDFVRQGYRRKKGLGYKWRRPRGRHSKTRVMFKGKINPVQIGYGSAKKIKGLDSKGRKGVLISNIKDLSKAKNYIILRRGIGKKKRVEIIKKALEMKLTLLNVAKPETYIKNIIEDLKRRKEGKKRVSETVKQVQDKKDSISDEEKKKTELDLKRKVLEGK